MSRLPSGHCGRLLLYPIVSLDRPVLPTTASGHLHQCRFGLRQPEGHLHSTVESNRSAQGGAGVLPLAGGGVQGPKAQVTVGLQGTHAECLSQGEGLLVVGGGVRHIWRSTAGGDLAEEPQRPRLLPAFCGARAFTSPRWASRWASSTRPARR